MNKEVKFLIKVAKKAAKLITNDMQVKAKGDKGDLVTNFDYEIEKYICKQINKNFPDFDIVSEEFNSKNKITKNCFTVDPIDGTINFVHGLPLWAIQIACIKNGKTCASVIYLPKFNELFYADDKNAYLNGKIIHVNNLELNKNLITIEGKEKIKLAVDDETQKVTSKIRIVGCAAIDFAWVACGRTCGTIFSKSTVWDYIPGQHLVEMAGGYIENKTNYHIGINNKKYVKYLK